MIQQQTQTFRRRIEALLPSASRREWDQAASAAPASSPSQTGQPTMFTQKPAWRRLAQNLIEITFISQAEEDAQLARFEQLARQMSSRQR